MGQTTHQMHPVATVTSLPMKRKHDEINAKDEEEMDGGSDGDGSGSGSQ